jgi:hypothetical protein
MNLAVKLKKKQVAQDQQLSEGTSVARFVPAEVWSSLQGKASADDCGH